MKTLMETLVPQEYALLFQEIERVVKQMPEVDLGADEQGKKILVSCHMVARALTHIFPGVKWEDGYFVRRGQRHSWLRVEGDRTLIIDPYPIAVLGGPIMVYVGFLTTPWDKLYIKAKLSSLGGAAFRRHVDVVIQAMKSVL